MPGKAPAADKAQIKYRKQQELKGRKIRNQKPKTLTVVGKVTKPKGPKTITVAAEIVPNKGTKTIEVDVQVVGK